MIEPDRLLRRPLARPWGAGGLLAVAAPLVLVAVAGLVGWALRPAPPAPTAAIAPRIAMLADPPVAPTIRLAWEDAGAIPGRPGALPAAAPGPWIDEAPRVAAAPPPADSDDPLPPVRRAAQPAPQAGDGPVLGFVPAPPRRPGRPPAQSPDAPPASGDLATRLQPAEGPAPLDLALGAITPRMLERSPMPPARPRQGARLPVLPAAAPGAVLADRLDPPPRRPAAVARLAATPTLAALGAVPAAPAPAIAMVEAAPLATRSAADGCGTALARAIPARPRNAAGGRAVMAGLAGAGGTGRDAALVRAVEQGNIPDHLRRLVPVTMAGNLPDGRRAQITLCVMPDYLAVGSDQDFVRIPLGLPAANRLAERFDMVLPTARMVDAIHAEARVRLSPSPMTPGAQMASTDYVVTHNATVEAQRRATGAALGHLVSGHKKDVVLTNRLTRVAGRVAIYGWHRGNGQPIQPLSTVHGQHYADYSHGIRLISRTAFVGGRAVDLLDLLADRRYAAILTGDEGPIATRQILASLR